MSHSSTYGEGPTFVPFSQPITAALNPAGQHISNCPNTDAVYISESVQNCIHWLSSGLGGDGQPEQAHAVTKAQFADQSTVPQMCTAPSRRLWPAQQQCTRLGGRALSPWQSMPLNCPVHCQRSAGQWQRSRSGVLTRDSQVLRTRHPPSESRHCRAHCSHSQVKR